MTAAFLSPIAWLGIVQACLVGALYAVGYLSVPDANRHWHSLLAEVLAVPRDMAAHRAALAYSGVTLGLTLALALTSVVWAAAGFIGWGRGFAQKGPAQWYRWAVLMSVLTLSVGFYFVLQPPWGGYLEPFPTAIGEALLRVAYAPAPSSGDPGAPLGSQLPDMMFLLAIVVPAVLAAAAGFLLKPLGATPDRVGQVALRLRELDHLLYLGALALVFGTLQLSTTMSVPLASLPALADLKNRVELCKTLAPTPASSPFLAASAVPSEDAFGLPSCQQLPSAIHLDGKAEALRQLVRNVTLATGLVFSAMLVAVYVPTLVSLGLMVESAAPTGEAAKPGAAALGEVDPLRRIAAAAATLGPFIAALVANAFDGG